MHDEQLARLKCRHQATHCPRKREAVVQRDAPLGRCAVRSWNRNRWTARVIVRIEEGCAQREPVGAAAQEYGDDDVTRCVFRLGKYDFRKPGGKYLRERCNNRDLCSSRNELTARQFVVFPATAILVVDIAHCPLNTIETRSS